MSAFPTSRPATTPDAARIDALYTTPDCAMRRTSEETLEIVLGKARVVGGLGAAAAYAGRHAPDTSRCGAIRRVAFLAHATGAPAMGVPNGWRPLIWLRHDQSWAAAYALEHRCAVLVEGTAVPDGWEAR